jgi:nicotinate phosphoribosyltransferase
MVDVWLRDEDVRELRARQFADPPYLNLLELLDALPSKRTSNRLNEPGRDISVEIQVASRRAPFAVLAGMPRALEMLKRCAGEWTENERFEVRSSQLDVWALHDGLLVVGDGVPLNSLPVLVVSGPYRYFAHLKTPLLGTLARASRVATNTFRLIEAAGGKPVFTFAARYDAHEVQDLDGYAYDVGVRTYNAAKGGYVDNSVSTYANARFTGASIVGTLSHEAIACFGGDLSALMIKFADAVPLDRLRVALVDFNNDCLRDAERVMRALFYKTLEAESRGDGEARIRYRLDGVRIDTSAELVDLSLAGLDSTEERHGVTASLVWSLRATIDNAWKGWDIPISDYARAEEWCKSVQIIASGGFNETRIAAFERAGVPVDAYGVGTALLSNCASEGSSTDFAAGVTRILGTNGWTEISKVGRKRAWDNRLTQWNWK